MTSLVVGIAGGTGSGKTTVAKTIAAVQVGKAHVVHSRTRVRASPAETAGFLSGLQASAAVFSQTGMVRTRLANLTAEMRELQGLNPVVKSEIAALGRVRAKEAEEP